MQTLGLYPVILNIGSYEVNLTSMEAPRSRINPHLLSAAKTEMPSTSGWFILMAYPAASVLGEILTARTSESDCAGGDVFKRIIE